MKKETLALIRRTVITTVIGAGAGYGYHLVMAAMKSG
jgi:ATP-dependent protease ClpP protease subunit